MCFEFWSIGQNVLQMLYFKIKSMLFEKDDGWKRRWTLPQPSKWILLAQKVYFFEDDGRAPAHKFIFASNFQLDLIGFCLFFKIPIHCGIVPFYYGIVFYCGTVHCGIVHCDIDHCGIVLEPIKNIQNIQWNF